jgi:hypothetical protein
MTADDSKANTFRPTDAFAAIVGLFKARQKTTSLKSIIAMLAVTICPSVVEAGEFNVVCYTFHKNVSPCAENIADIVTEKFTAKFPASKYSIWIYSNAMPFPSGEYVAWAESAVIRRGSTKFPLRRSATSKIGRDNISNSLLPVANLELEVFRSVVTRMMEQCEVSPSCALTVND